MPRQNVKTPWEIEVEKVQMLYECMMGLLVATKVAVPHMAGHCDDLMGHLKSVGGEQPAPRNEGGV